MVSLARLMAHAMLTIVTEESWILERIWLLCCYDLHAMHAMLTIVTEESWILERIWLSVDGQIRFEYVTCGRESF